MIKIILNVTHFQLREKIRKVQMQLFRLAYKYKN